ncbi:hypothetical protein ACS0TY_020373 [Phlomoides rotata]
MRMVARKNAQLTLLLKALLDRTIMLVSIGIAILNLTKHDVAGNGRRRKFSIMDRIPAQLQNMSYLVELSDEDCKNQLRMDRNCFYRLCDLLQNNGGLKPSKYISVYEKMAMFLSILAHHSKNRCVKFQFKRSGQTVSNMDPVATRVGEDVEQVKPSRGRQSWTRVEEDALINCLTDIVNDGWKAENGFKAGFQRELEKGMRKRLPGTNIVANPHINSKIHVWKKEYNALSDILSKSGIGWNSTTSMIEVEDEGVWDASKRADPQMKSICFKTWPYYSSWLDIFGKDRATGENAGIGPSTEPQVDNKKLNEIMNAIVGLKRDDRLKVCDELKYLPEFSLFGPAIRIFIGPRQHQHSGGQTGVDCSYSIENA